MDYDVFLEVQLGARLLMPKNVNSYASYIPNYREIEESS